MGAVSFALGRSVVDRSARCIRASHGCSPASNHGCGAGVAMGRGRGPMGTTARKTVGSPVRVHSFVDLTNEDSEEAGTPECSSAPREPETARKTVVTPPDRPVRDPTQASSSAPPSRAGGSASTAPEPAAPASGAGASTEEKSALATSPTGSPKPLSSTFDRQVSNSPLCRWTCTCSVHLGTARRWGLRAV